MGIAEFLKKRNVLGPGTPLLDGQWQDEYGTEEEIRDLGKFVAELLTTRHYRWVTHNQELKNVLAYSFPPVSIESLDSHRKDYDKRRKMAREQSKPGTDYDTIKEQYKQACQEITLLQKQVRILAVRVGDKPFENNSERDLRLTGMQFGAGISGFG